MKSSTSRKLRVFLCHANVDKKAIRSLHTKLDSDEIDAWLDEKALIPGQDWRIEIPKAIRSADAVIVCLSHSSINKEGYVQKEIKYALDIADEKPDGAIYIIPAKLDECSIPERLERWQWVELFREDGYIRLLNALRKRAKDIHIKPMTTPRLRIQAFGKPQVAVYGKVIPISQWRTRSVRDLFFFLFTLSKPMTKEEVGVELWPEIRDLFALNRRFNNELQRLRSAIGKDAIIYDDGSYQFNHELEYEYDVDNFNALLEKADSTREDKAKIVHYRAAVDLVQGSYLSEIDGSWTVPEREQLEITYLQTLLRLAELLFENGEEREALQTCQRALAHDPCLEEAHQIIMKIFYKLKDRGAIARQYKVCKDALDTMLCVLPSPETEELYKTLLSKT